MISSNQRLAAGEHSLGPGVTGLGFVCSGIPHGGIDKQTHARRRRRLRSPAAKASASMLCLLVAISEPPEEPKSKRAAGFAVEGAPPRSRATRRLTYSARD